MAVGEKFIVNITSILRTLEQGPLGSNGHFGTVRGLANKDSILTNPKEIEDHFNTIFKKLFITS